MTDALLTQGTPTRKANDLLQGPLSRIGTRARRPTAHGFTLVELLVVIAIILVLGGLLVAQVPSAIRWYKVHLSQTIMAELELAVTEYKRIYGDYPCELVKPSDDGTRLVNWITDDNGWRGKDTCHYGNTQGFLSLYLSLQGLNGAGWGPTAEHPNVKQFGPMPVSPSYVNWTVQATPYFECPFGREILYYQARVDVALSVNGKPNPYGSRYMGLVNAWAWQDGKQRGADESGDTYMYVNWRPHFRKRLTRTVIDGVAHPHNPKSYILWMAGEHGRFGYWAWSDEHGGYVVDRVLDDDGGADGVVGECRNILNTD